MLRILVGMVAATMSLSVLAQSNKPVVAIGPIQLSAQNISCKGWDRANCNQDLSDGFRQMLETAISKTGKMDVMERGQLDTIIAEQGLGEMGLTTSGGRVGGLTGVDYFVYGTITKFGARESGTSIGTDTGVGSLFGSRTRQAAGAGVSKGSVETEMGVDLKVTNTSNGQIVMADHVEDSVKAGSSFAVGGIQRAEASADPFADVQRKVAARISEAIVTARIPIKVIQVQGDGTLILNYGNVFFAAGDQLAAFEVGESFVDPDTGEVLGSEETEVGRVEITRSEQKFSRARVVGEPFQVAAGMTLKRSLLAQQRRGDDQPSSRKRSGADW